MANIASSASAVPLLAANTARISAIVSNNSTAILYIGLGFNPTAANFTAALAGTGAGAPASWPVPFGFTGALNGIWSMANGNATANELT